MIRVRFAPSPTGYLHIGGARTALFNWMYAKSQEGKFILRIEDTDMERSKQEYVDEIIDSLAWLGFKYDELYFQSKRFDIYKEHALKLLNEGKAFKDGEAVVLKIPQEQQIKLYDLIRGEITFDPATIKDQVLMKSDGSPTYSFACVVDDALMEISHVIRGEDHISNTPKQILIYQALGFKLPKFAHLPLIMGEEGGRLSKRTGAVAVTEYRTMGFLPEAIVNYLMLLGWSPGGNQEVIKFSDAVKKFSIKKVNKTAAEFSMDKLRWINGQYLNAAPAPQIADLAVPLLKEKGYIQENFDRNKIENAVKLFQSRMETLNDFLERADFVFTDQFNIDAEAKEKYLVKDKAKDFKLLGERFFALEDFNVKSVEEAFRHLVAERGIAASDLVHPVRVALTGKAVGPGLFETIALLGKEKTVKRLALAADSL
ncbi:MAG TPA: glutamate--tRNA ligase [Candidatus Omnitrophota bacterium]|nr:glutamate--tRNA ligase [Candidatus Omnitrophota bacterium]HPD84559.1 glutamate--tRNA ligase [Candidatus Omnitrophota bacterium]HRZ03417.1 glutamate--tRNA ligase [Candidatus Omnitrophota bacterium]